MNARYAIFAGDPAAVLAQHRALLAKPWQQRAADIVGPVAMVGMLVFSIWWLDISFGQIGPGLGALFKFIGLMFPPSTGGHLKLFLVAMAETLSIAFLGTLVASGWQYHSAFSPLKIHRPIEYCASSSAGCWTSFVASIR